MSIWRQFFLPRFLHIRWAVYTRKVLVHYCGWVLMPVNPFRFCNSFQVKWEASTSVATTNHKYKLNIQEPAHAEIHINTQSCSKTKGWPGSSQYECFFRSRAQKLETPRHSYIFCHHERENTFNIALNKRYLLTFGKVSIMFKKFC